MKIFNEEKGIKKVYVQLNDIARLMDFGEAIPVSIMKRFFYNIFIVNDDNRYKFEEFTEPHEIDFFKELDWIVNYKKYRDMSEKEIMDQGYALGDEMNQVAKEHNDSVGKLTDEELVALELKHEALEHKMLSIRDILWIKQGHLSVPIPEVPDVDGFSLTGDNDEFPYVARQGLNPVQFLISRKDGKDLNLSEVIPMGFLQSAQALSITENTNKNEFFGDFESTNKLSEDKKSLIVTNRIITPEEREEQEKQAISDNEKILGCPSKDSKMSLRKRFSNKLKELFNK